MDANAPSEPRPVQPSKIAQALARSPVFGVLSAAARQAIEKRGWAVSLEREAELFKRGDASDAAYVILRGEIEISVEGMDGRDVWIARMGAGAIIGEMGVLDDSPRSADARATRNTELWRIDRALVTDALTGEPGAALALLSVMVRRLRTTDGLVERNAPLNLSKRLARLLLDEAINDRIINNQSDLAHVIGATREAVNRKLSSWRKSGWVELTPTGLYIRDRAALLSLCRQTAES